MSFFCRVCWLVLFALFSRLPETRAAAFFGSRKHGDVTVLRRADKTTCGTASNDTSSILSPELLHAYDEDGFIVLRGLFDPEEVENMVAAGETLAATSKLNVATTFSVVEKNLIYGSIEDDHERRAAIQVFRNVALRSRLGQVCAELMGLDSQTQCVRLLRDVFLAKPATTGIICDWHVDDQSFWPESFRTGNNNEDEEAKDGVNVWIALEDFSPAYGGSMILSKASHKAPWRTEAYLSISQNRTTDGGRTMKQLVEAFSHSASNGTCALDMSNPRIRSKVEAAKVDFHLKKGDCILATRLLFHRTARLTERGEKFYARQGKPLLHRYSIRYVPGTARLPKGDPLELSVKYSKAYAGKTLDRISGSRERPAWYPRVWPQVDANIDSKLDDLAKRQLPKAKSRNEADYTKMIESLKQIQQQKKQ